jgi:hypothetical protein
VLGEETRVYTNVCRCKGWTRLCGGCAATRPNESGRAHAQCSPVYARLKKSKGRDGQCAASESWSGDCIGLLQIILHAVKDMGNTFVDSVEALGQCYFAYQRSNPRCRSQAPQAIHPALRRRGNHTDVLESLKAIATRLSQLSFLYRSALRVLQC